MKSATPLYMENCGSRFSSKVFTVDFVTCILWNCSAGIRVRTQYKQTQ